MKDIGEQIRQRRTRLGWTVQKLATLAGIDNGFLSKLETGKASGSWDTYIKLAGALGVPIESMLTNKGNVVYASVGHRSIPVLDYVQAISWSGVDSSLSEGEIRETIMTDLEHPPSTFAMRVRGDSMEPDFKAGDIVVIDPTEKPRPGDFVVAKDDGDEAIFMRYRNLGLNEHGVAVFELHPLNTHYAPMRSDRQKLTVLGTIVEHRRFLKR